MTVNTSQLDTGPFSNTSAEKKPGLVKRILGPDNYRLLKALFTNSLSVAGMIILGFFIVIALAAPVLAPHAPGKNPYRIPRDGFSAPPRPPGSEWRTRQPPLPFWWKTVMGTDEWVHLMGTAGGQWDIYYGVVWGTRTAFRIGIMITIAVVIIGLTIGSIAAYYGGWIDNVLMRITDVFLAFPFLVAALTLSAIMTPIFGKGITPVIIAIIVFGWMGYARLIRSDILTVRERDFVVASRVMGAKNGRILRKHILPNAIFPTIVVASMGIGSYVLTFAALSFLGIGAEVGFADWGQLLSFARDWITQLNVYWYTLVFPGVALILFVLAWNLVGDAIRDVFDPRMRGRGGA